MALLPTHEVSGLFADLHGVVIVPRHLLEDLLELIRHGRAEDGLVLLEVVKVPLDRRRARDQRGLQVRFQLFKGLLEEGVQLFDQVFVAGLSRLPNEVLQVLLQGLQVVLDRFHALLVQVRGCLRQPCMHCVQPLGHLLQCI